MQNWGCEGVSYSQGNTLTSIYMKLCLKHYQFCKTWDVCDSQRNTLSSIFFKWNMLYTPSALQLGCMWKSRKYIELAFILKVFKHTQLFNADVCGSHIVKAIYWQAFIWICFKHHFGCVWKAYVNEILWQAPHRFRDLETSFFYQFKCSYQCKTLTKRFCYLFQCRATKAQASLRKCADSPELLVLS